MNSFDLHMHSIYSNDGQYTPKELIAMIQETGLKYVALTDHDCIQGVNEFQEEAIKHNLIAIPAIECSTLFKDYPVHVLGYGIDLDYPYFQTLTKKVRDMVEKAFYLRTEKIITKYQLDIDIKRLVEENKGKNLWNIFCKRIFNDPRNWDIPDLKDYIPGGRRSEPASVNFSVDKLQPGSDLYVKIPFPSFEETIKHIHEAGGIAILAHPFRNFYKQEERLFEAMRLGIDGIEAYSNYHEPFHNSYYENFAKTHDLLITCGSDFHGELKPKIKLGEYGLNENREIYLLNLINKLKL